MLGQKPVLMAVIIMALMTTACGDSTHAAAGTAAAEENTQVAKVDQSHMGHDSHGAAAPVNAATPAQPAPAATAEPTDDHRAAPAAAASPKGAEKKAAPPAAVKPATDPNCPPEHAEMGHCTPSSAPQ
nr:hypothetical protein [Sphingomonas sp. Y57]